MLSKLRKKLSRRASGCLGIQIRCNRSMAKTTPTRRTKYRERITNLRTTLPIHKKRRVTWRRRRTSRSGASSIKSPSPTLLNVSQSSHWWSRSKLWSQIPILTLIQNLSSQSQTRGHRSLMHNPASWSLPQRSNQVILKSHRKVNDSSTHRCGWRVLHYISVLTMGVKRTWYQGRSWNGWSFWQHHTHPTTLDC